MSARESALATGRRFFFAGGVADVPSRVMRALAQSCRRRCAGPSEAKAPSDARDEEDSVAGRQSARATVSYTDNPLPVPAVRVDVVADADVRWAIWSMPMLRRTVVSRRREDVVQHVGRKPP